MTPGTMLTKSLHSRAKPAEISGSELSMMKPAVIVRKVLRKVSWVIANERREDEDLVEDLAEDGLVQTCTHAAGTDAASCLYDRCWGMAVFVQGWFSCHLPNDLLCASAPSGSSAGLVQPSPAARPTGGPKGDDPKRRTMQVQQSKHMRELRNTNLTQTV